MKYLLDYLNENMGSNRHRYNCIVRMSKIFDKPNDS